jgi:hypothetical protein
MLLDSYLADASPIEIYENIVKSSIFVGCEIKNLYDEKRIAINTFNGIEPKRFAYKPTLYANSAPLFLYGFNFFPKGEDRHLVNELKTLTNIDLITYNNILKKYNYEPGENFLKLTQNIYPIDIVHIERYMPGFNYSSFFSRDTEIPDFQQLTSINLYILIKD